MKYIIAFPLHRNGESDWEYYHPDSTGYVPKRVFEAREAKKYRTRQEALSMLPDIVDEVIDEYIGRTPMTPDEDAVIARIRAQIWSGTRIIPIPSLLERWWYRYIRHTPPDVEWISS